MYCYRRTWPTDLGGLRGILRISNRTHPCYPAPDNRERPAKRPGPRPGSNLASGARFRTRIASDPYGRDHNPPTVHNKLCFRVKWRSIDP